MTAPREDGCDPSGEFSDAQPAGLTLDARFRQLFDTHSDFVWRSLVRLGLGPADADDAVQEVFLVVHRKLEQFERRGLERAWLHAIARRVAGTHRRTNERRERRTRERINLVRDPVTPEQNVAQREAAELVDRFLRSLPEPQREVFVLAEIEGLRGPEIATALGHNLNTVYTRLRAARRDFRRWLDHEHGERSEPK